MTRGGKRLGAGRKPSNDAPTDHLHIRVSPARLAAYREAAARVDQTLSEWAQLHLDEATAKKMCIHCGEEATVWTPTCQIHLR